MASFIIEGETTGLDLALSFASCSLGGAQYLSDYIIP